MKTKSLFQSLVLVAILPFNLLAGAKTITLQNTEKYKNEIHFLSDAPLEKIQGTASTISGSFAIDLQNLAATSGTLTVPVSSMTTGSSSRDNHMMAEEWLNASVYKAITWTLKSLAVEKVDNSVAGRTIVTATAKGDFTLHGQTHPLEAKVTITYLTESAQTKSIASGDLALVKAEFNVPLKQYGIFGKGNVVGSKVGENIQISAQLFGSSGGQ